MTKEEDRYKIKILGGAEDGNVKGYFTGEQLPQAIDLMTQKFGKDWVFDIQKAND